MTASLPEPPELSPRVAEADTAARPLSTPAAIVISGLTAVIVMAGGVLIAERLGPPRSTEPLAPPPRPTVVLPAESAAPAVAPSAPPTIVAAAATAAASAAPVAASAAPVAASAAPVASSAAPIALAPPAVPATDAPLAADAPRDPARLPERRGYLLVSGPAGARVYIKGADVGGVNEALTVPCGLSFVRLGSPLEGKRYPTWIGAGVSAVIACRGETRVAAGLPEKP
jgi:hypothetical protein